MRWSAWMSRDVGRRHVQRRAVEDAVGRVLAERDLLEHLALGESTVRPPEIVVHTNSRPSARTPCRPARGRRSAGRTSSPRRRPSGERRAPSTPSSTSGPARRRRCRWGRRSGRSASISPPPFASSTNSLPVAGTAARGSCSVPESVNHSRPSGPKARSLGPASVWPAISEESSSTLPSGFTRWMPQIALSSPAAGDVAALGDVDRAVRSEHGAPRRAAGDRVNSQLAVPSSFASRRCSHHRTRRFRRA